jgi:replicative DNA helicase
VALFSLEMRPTQLCERMLSAEGQVSMRSLRKNRLSALEMERLREARERLGVLPITIDESYSEPVEAIVSRCRALKLKSSNLRLVVTTTCSFSRASRLEKGLPFFIREVKPPALLVE